jgi:hypothetical protein
MNVYVLTHTHDLGDDHEDVKMIGVYESEATARIAISRLGTQPGFSTSPEGFHIDCYELNKDEWTQGFVTVP